MIMMGCSLKFRHAINFKVRTIRFERPVKADFLSSQKPLAAS